MWVGKGLLNKDVGRMASVGKVRLLKQKAEEGRKGQWRSWIISIIAEAGEKEVR